MDGEFEEGVVVVVVVVVVVGVVVLPNCKNKIEFRLSILINGEINIPLIVFPSSCLRVAF